MPNLAGFGQPQLLITPSRIQHQLEHEMDASGWMGIYTCMCVYGVYVDIYYIYISLSLDIYIYAYVYVYVYIGIGKLA